MSTFLKDPDERIDYTVDWDTDDWLGSDTISTSAWTVPAGITQYGSATNTNTTATIWLTGGTHGQQYVVSNKVTTADGRIGERSLLIVVRNR